MDIDKLLKQFKKYAEQEWSNGWDAGYESATNDNSLDEYKEMLSFRMSLIYDNAIKNNKFREAKLYKEIIEYLDLDFINDPYNSIEVK
jgi:hypothetical protein